MMEMCDWHVMELVLDDETGEVRLESMLHPSSCGVVVSTVPSPLTGALVTYECFIEQNLRESGDIAYMHFAECEPGWYRVRGRWFEHPSGPWGPAEGDAESEDQKMKWVAMEPRIDAERGVDF